MQSVRSGIRSNLVCAGLSSIAIDGPMGYWDSVHIPKLTDYCAFNGSERIIDSNLTASCERLSAQRFEC